MKLEVERLQLNISAADRDRTLLSIGTYPTMVLDALVFDYVRVLISSRRRVHADTAAYKALDEVTGSSLLDGLSDRNRLFAIEVLLKQLLAGEESLAEFPLHCSFIDAVSG
ncbi:hypothetical protein GOBAR_AA00242 [Gossypium barbadense]|uniref:Uncharacterized protein n=1 Tax=Gossypium barbadense TaxID=3634 RepID=A0A2P5YXT7_GOSBA|nr:hypothetical protein GOBAR_AA00242 [Gossypium barbadense]